MARLRGGELGLPLFQRSGLRAEEGLGVEELEVALLGGEDDVLNGLVVLEVGGDEGLPRLLDDGVAAAEVKEEVAERERRRDGGGGGGGAARRRADDGAAGRGGDVDFGIVRAAPAAEVGLGSSRVEPCLARLGVVG